MELFDKPPVEVVAYTAGLIDGEGSISFINQNNRFGCFVGQSTVNNGEDLLRWLQEQWGGLGTIHKQRKAFGKYRYDFWMWSVNAARELEHLLAACLPYLRVKRAKAEQALDHIRERLKATDCRYKWTPKECEYIREHAHESTTAVAAAIGRSEPAVRHRRRSMGLDHPPNCREWPAEQEQFLRANLDKSDREIGQAVGKTRRAVRAKRDRLGLRKR